MGELHLEVVRHRLEREFRLAVRVGPPRVAYKETVARAAEGEGRFARRLGERGVFGHVRLRIEPAADLLAVAVAFEAPPGTLPKPFLPAIESAIREAGTTGVAFGYPIVHVRAVVTGGSTHETDGNEAAYAAAAQIAFREALEAAGERLLEPVMRFEVETPPEYSGGILTDLQARRAEVSDLRVEGELRRIAGFVPLGEMFGYTTILRSLSQGRASISLEPARYAAAPEEVLRRILY